MAAKLRRRGSGEDSIQKAKVAAGAVGGGLLINSLGQVLGAESRQLGRKRPGSLREGVREPVIHKPFPGH